MIWLDFGKGAAAQISIGFNEIGVADPARLGSGDVCVVIMKLSPRPRFVVENGQSRPAGIHEDRQRDRPPEGAGDARHSRHRAHPREHLGRGRRQP